MEEQIPEILRCPLEQLVLMSKVVDPSLLPEQLLGLAIDPPDLGNIRRTIKILKEVCNFWPTYYTCYTYINMA
jgi:ATP-dependent RNA helicase TDRD9